MKLHRFIGKFDFTDDFFGIADKEIFNQIKNVLRLGVGDKIILGDGRENEVTALIDKLDKNIILVKVLERTKNENESENRVTLYCSVLKKENFEFVVEKATEIGVAAVVPLITKRTVKFSLKRNRLEKIIREAAEQAGRGIVPVIGEPKEFQKAILQATGNDLNVLFDPRGNDFHDIFKPRGESQRIGIMIGPEGGWDESEIIFAKENGFKIVNIGKLVFRAETAAIIASHLILN
jgi:16S rRNA (uracil1498-N3)-methyltransferase